VAWALGQRRDRAAGADGDRRQSVAHLAGLIATVHDVAEAELAAEVPAPALDGVIVKERTGWGATGGDRERGSAGAERDRREVVTHLVE